MSRKAEIFNAILKILSEKGTSSFSTTEIAKIVGFSQPALYRHFKNKNELILFFIEELKHKLEKIIEKANSGKDFFDKLEKLYEAHFDFVEKTKVIPRFVFSDEIFDKNSTEKMEKFKKVCFNYYMREIENIFKNNGIKKVNSEVCAKLLMGSFLSYSLKWLLSGMNYSLKDEIPEMMEFWKNYFKGYSN